MWRLAIAALLLLGVRKLAGLGYEHTAGAPGDLFPGPCCARWSRPSPSRPASGTR